MTATVAELTRPQIPLAVNSAVIAADEKDLGHKQAAAGVTDQNTVGFTFIGAVPIANDLEWDTSGLPDDDKDVLIKLRNINSRQDDFNPDFTGVTGEFLDIHRFATSLNTPFRKVPGQGENYQVDHSSNVVLINPRGDYHGFFKAPLDQGKMKLTYRSARAIWEKQK